MANGVNVKMGVSGVAQFKQSINQAKTSIKTLDAQLALTEKQYKATGDAETYMQQKTEQLQGKMDAQKQVVQNAEKALQEMTKRGVDMSSKAFQDMIQTLAKANADLLDTQMQMQGVEAASDDAAAAITDMNSDLSNIGSQISFKTVTDGLTRITDGLQAAATKAVNFGKAMLLASMDSAAWADEINTEAKKAGIDPERYQQMMKAALEVDTSIDSILSSQQKLAQATEKDNEAMAKIFATLGVQTKRYGEVRDLNDLFWETGEALMKIDNEADRADMGKKLFGQWRELIPMFEMGREAYEKLVDSEGFVKKENLDSLNKLNDSYEKLQGNIDDLRNSFFAELAPHIQTITDALGGLVKRFNEYLQSEKGKEMMDSLGENIEKLFSSITNFDPEDAIKKVGNVMDGIKTGFEWISNNWESVETGLKAIAAGWGAIKLATWGLKIAELVAGLKGLGFGGGSGTPTTPTVDANPKGSPVGGGKSLIPTMASNVMNKAAQNALTVGANAGMIIPVLSDRLLNETEGGRALRDNQGLEAVIEGTRQDVTKAADEFVKNLHTFNDDWATLVNTAWNDTFGVEGGGGSHGFGLPDEKTLQENESAIEKNMIRLRNARMQQVGWDEEEYNRRWGEAGKQAVESAENGVNEQAPQLEEDTKVIGENAAIGLANGIDAKADEAIKAAEDLAAKVAAALAGALEVRSPSRVMERIGEYVSAGFAEGIENGYDKVNEAVDNMARVASSVAGGRGSGATSSKMIDVTLMIGPEKLTEVVVPLVDNSLGAEIDLMRR